MEIFRSNNPGKIGLRELGGLLGEKHPQIVKHHLNQLVKKGYLKIRRSTDLRFEIIEVNSVADDTAVRHGMWIDIPIVGAASCGLATVFADETIDGYVRVSEKILPSNVMSVKKRRLFAIKADGNSMNKAIVGGKNIESGDFVVVDGTYRNPRNGDFVLSVIDNVANIKKYFFDKMNNEIRLESESTEELAPIYVHPDDSGDYLINGKIIAVLKRPSKS
ncbi:MAG: S24 family peptidase [Patescibacteria group bacterium]